MLWASVLLLALAVGQVPAKSTKVAEADFVENVVSKDSRIVSGWEARPGQHPHHCNLRMQNAAGQLFSCGGSVVHANWVLSAAHCTAQRVSIVVRAGLVFLNDARYVQETTEWYNHPTYVDEMAHIVQPNDVALIRLRIAIVFSVYIKPIRLQARADAFRSYEGMVLYASGHGRTWTGGATAEALQWVYLRGLANSNCQRVFGSALITDNSICAQYFNVTSQSTCHGDSGGPLVYEDNGVPTLIGVASFVAGEASGGCHSGFPAGFIRPGPFHAWFLLITGLDFEFLDDTTTETPTTTTTTTTTAAPQTTVTQAPQTTVTQAPQTTVTQAPQTTVTQAPPAQTTTWQPTTTTEYNTIAPEEPEGPEEPECPEEPEGPPNPPEEPEGPPHPPEEPGDCDDDEDDDDDCGLSELLKKLEVEVKVKVKLNKFGKKKKIHHHHNHTISHQRDQ